MDHTFLFGLFHIFVALCCIYMTALCSVKREYENAYRALKYYSLVIGIVALLHGIYFIYPSLKIDSYLLAFINGIRPFISVFFFYFVFTICYPKKKTKLLLLLFIVPFIVCALSLTFNFHNLYITYSSCHYYRPFRTLIEDYHVLFYVFLGYNYALVLVSVTLLLIHIKKLSNHKKREKINLSILIVLYLTFHILSLFIYFAPLLWAKLIFAVLVVYGIYYTLYSNEERKIKEEGEKELIDNHPFPIVLQNSEDKIVYANQAALTVCPRLLDYKEKDHFYDEIYDCFSFYSLKKDIENKGFNAKVSSILQKKNTGELFFINTKNIYDTDKQIIGKLHMLVAVSNMSEFLKTLEESTFKDTICNVYNKYFLNIKEDEYTKEEALPLSVLRVEIQNLDIIKKNSVPQRSEECVMLFVFIMRQVLRKNDMIFRLNENTFLVVLPYTHPRALITIKNDIFNKEKEFASLFNGKVYLKIGSASTLKLPIDMGELIERAKIDDKDDKDE